MARTTVAGRRLQSASDRALAIELQLLMKASATRTRKTKPKVLAAWPAMRSRGNSSTASAPVVACRRSRTSVTRPLSSWTCRTLGRGREGEGLNERQGGQLDRGHHCGSGGHGPLGAHHDRQRRHQQVGDVRRQLDVGGREVGTDRSRDPALERSSLEPGPRRLLKNPGRGVVFRAGRGQFAGARQQRRERGVAGRGGVVPPAGPDDTVQAFLADHRRDLFPDELFADLFRRGGAGRRCRLMWSRR